MMLLLAAFALVTLITAVAVAIYILSRPKPLPPPSQPFRRARFTVAPNSKPQTAGRLRMFKNNRRIDR